MAVYAVVSAEAEGVRTIRVQISCDQLVSKYCCGWPAWGPR